MTLKPSKVLDLTNWQLTLPIGKPLSPLNVFQPELNDYVNDTHFTVSTSNPEFVLFRAHAGGVTTKNSKNARSELREMNGKERAIWSTKKGKHTMVMTQKVMALPEVRSSVVMGQIHRGSDDLIEIRCWIPKGSTTPVIDVFHDSTIYGILDPAYELGEVYTIKVHVFDKIINVYYNDMEVPKLKIPASCTTCFFKAGCYTQANPTSHKGVLPEFFGEVHMSHLEIKHAP